MYKDYIKRLIDIIIALISLILLFPAIILIALIVWINMGKPVFFLQERIGQKMKIYKIWKFRTMINNAEKIGSGVFTHSTDLRITKIGKFLRKYSLDEIPQIINILIGNMSFIGPRPPVRYHPYKINEYPKKYLPRFEVKPGMTGLAQISGRTNLTWPQRFNYDLEYVKKISFLTDIKIIIKTVLIITKGKDVFPEDHNVGKNHFQKYLNEV